MKFPKTLDEEDMELAKKEWTLAGYSVNEVSWVARTGTLQWREHEVRVGEKIKAVPEGTYRLEGHEWRLRPK